MLLVPPASHFVSAFRSPVVEPADSERRLSLNFQQAQLRPDRYNESCDDLQYARPAQRPNRPETSPLPAIFRRTDAPGSCTKSRRAHPTSAGKGRFTRAATRHTITPGQQRDRPSPAIYRPPGSPPRPRPGVPPVVGKTPDCAPRQSSWHVPPAASPGTAVVKVSFGRVRLARSCLVARRVQHVVCQAAGRSYTLAGFPQRETWRTIAARVGVTRQAAGSARETPSPVRPRSHPARRSPNTPPGNRTDRT